MPPLPELLAPAGQPDAGYAALHYGADAVYLGLNRFSARAEAVNFTPRELEEFTAYAHSLTPARKVYLTLNTLVKGDELAEAAETMFIADECDVDAVIVQDLGVARLARERFPDLPLHASTQLAIHNREGLRAAARLGFSRVVTARELTLDELRDIADGAEIEVETFIHGTLCYSYSGLCLFSSIVAGRSGNRGRCVYSCREAATAASGRTLHPFSLKDLALGSRVADLARAGAASLKIEGRKKSPLYVAATVDYYRRILDGRMAEGDIASHEARLRTIFARPWTRLFLDNRRNPDAADTEIVGHRGSHIGGVEKFLRTPTGPGIVFHSTLPVERHDGLQIDIPGEAKPYGFGIEHLYIVEKGRPRSVFEAPAGVPLATTLPENAPPLSVGLPLYLASSQTVKQAFPFDKPRDGSCARKCDVDVSIRIAGSGDGCRIDCRAAMTAAANASDPRPAEPPAFSLSMDVPGFPARNAEGAEQAARAAFERTGGSGFRVSGWRFENRDERFVRPGVWNHIRRELLRGLADACGRSREEAKRKILAGVPEPRRIVPRPSGSEVFWSVAVDAPSSLSLFDAADFAAVGEAIAGFQDETFETDLEQLTDALGRNRIRLTVPLILRGADARRAARRVRELVDAGWRRWFISNLGALPLFQGLEDIDLLADWPLYALNPAAAEMLLALGLSGFTISPEDEAANIRKMVAAYPQEAHAVVYSDLPLFISAACAHAHMGLCRAGKLPSDSDSRRAAEELRMVMDKSGAITIQARGCGSIVTGEHPFSLAGRLELLTEMGLRNFRVDLRWRQRSPREAQAVWRQTRAGKTPAGATEANFLRGLR